MSVQEKLAAAEARLAELEIQRDAALSQVVELRATLEEDAPFGQAEKVRLFGELFQARRDVFPQRWAKRGSARSGYAPACRNEWVAGICEKPRIRCGVCPNQAFIPVADEVLRDHLQGRIVAGVYPLLRDDSCWFVAIDPTILPFECRVPPTYLNPVCAVTHPRGSSRHLTRHFRGSSNYARRRTGLPWNIHHLVHAPITRQVAGEAEPPDSSQLAAA